jgi:ubiquitin-protein ligase
MNDPVLSGFLKKQFEEGMALAAESDILELEPLSLGSRRRGDPPNAFLASLRCKGLVLAGEPDQVEEGDLFEVRIQFPEDYLRHVIPMLVLTLVFPMNVWHPNVSLYGPFICAGRIAPGTALVDLIYQTFEILTYQKVTMREDDALNPAACSWARKNQHRFPIDPRPLKRRALDFEIEALQGADRR